jgi:hypothetical protein
MSKTVKTRECILHPTLYFFYRLKKIFAKLQNKFHSTKFIFPQITSASVDNYFQIILSKNLEIQKIGLILPYQLTNNNASCKNASQL